MRRKIEESSFDALPEHEQLEVILFSVIHRGNTNEIAHRLLQKHGSIYGVLTADVDTLTEVEGVGKRVAEFLHSLPAVLGVVMRSKIMYETGGGLENIEALKTYLFSLFADSISERVYVLFLNRKLQVIRFEKVGEGTIEDAYIDVVRIARSAVINNAAFVVLTHNHPSGTASPSAVDMTATREVKESLELLGVELLDHIIISGDRYYSFRERNCL